MERVLLIDDEAELRSSLRANLMALGHEVTEAQNGREGLERFEAAPVDVVITDVLMPIMDGLELIPLLKRVRPNVKVIAMCGGGSIPAGSYLRVARSLGADYVLAKPFSPAELEIALEALLPPRPSRDVPRTFLVLDDNVDSRFLNRALLEQEFPQSTVVECGSIAEALAASQGQRLDAVITDHHLGASEGTDFVAQLRARGASCPVLMVTGSSDPRVHARAYAAGATRVFFGRDTNFPGYLRTQLTGPARDS